MSARDRRIESLAMMSMSAEEFGRIIRRDVLETATARLRRARLAMTLVTAGAALVAALASR